MGHRAAAWAISIHALREEGDVRRVIGVLVAVKFLSTPSARRATETICHAQDHSSISIHALREEGDLASFGHASQQVEFLSTPSARRATPGFMVYSSCI